MSFAKQLQNARGEMSRHEFCAIISPLLNPRTYEGWELGRNKPNEFFSWLLLRRIEHVFKIKMERK